MQIEKFLKCIYEFMYDIQISNEETLILMNLINYFFKLIRKAI